MAIDSNSKSMLEPTSNGKNFGISNSWTQKEPGNQATNYRECVDSVQGSENIEFALSKVTSSGASGQDYQNNLVKNGGSKLGMPYKGSTRD